MKKRYSYRAWPTSRQKRDLARLFGCCRYVYNRAILDHQAVYEAGLHQLTEPAPTPADPGRTRRACDVTRQAAVVTYERARHPWLRRAPSVALIQSIRDADQAFKNFFASATGRRKGPKVGFPRLKSRFSNRQAARFTRDGFSVRGDRVMIAKIGWIRFTLSRPLPAPPSSVTIIAHKDGSYQVSFVVEVDRDTVPTTSTRHAAIDLGVKDLGSVVYSDGTRQRLPNPRYLKKAHKKLARAQRSLARKQGPDKKTSTKASNSWRKQQRKVARLHAHVAACRKDLACKTANRLAANNATISIESLNLRGLSRSGGQGAQGRGLRRSFHDAALGVFIQALRNAAGDRLITINPAYTSQVCAVCGVLDGPKPLHVRTWTCKNCAATLDRDFNAAVNIMSAAGRADSLNAGGSGIRLALAQAPACNLVA